MNYKAGSKPVDSDEVLPRSKELRDFVEAERNTECTQCPLSLNPRVTNVCLFGHGNIESDGMIIYENPSRVDDERNRPLVNIAGSYVRSVFDEVGLDYDQYYVSAGVKCYIPSADEFSDLLKEHAEACSTYLDKEIRRVKPKVVLVMGMVGFHFFTNRFGTLTSRAGSFYSEEFECWVIPTVDPEYVLTYPQYHEVFLADVHRFRRFLLGNQDNPPVHLIMVDTIEKFREAMDELVNHEPDEKVLTFDLETRGFVDHDPEYSRVWCVAFTRGRRDEKGMRSFMIPIEHPDSPFMEEPGWFVSVNGPKGKCDQEVVEGVVNLIKNSNVCGHNVKFDVRHTIKLAERYGIEWNDN